MMFCGYLTNAAGGMLAVLLISLFFSSCVYAQHPVAASGSIHHLEMFRSNYVQARNIDVWLPPGYRADKKYAVLYMHDGQNLFDGNITWNHQEWNVDEVLTQLLAEEKVKDCIVVGIWNGELNRGREYFPEQVFKLIPPAYQEKLLAAQYKGNNIINGQFLGDSYLKFIVEELKPFIDKTYAVYTDQKNTFMAGSSYGGLISMYAVCQYPTVFGGAACLSTHWPGIAEDNDVIPQAFQRYLIEHLPDPKDHRLYFDYGSVMLDGWYKAHQQKVDSIMKAKGYDSKNWMTKEFVGEDHSENAWSKRLHIPLVFMLAKEDK